MRTIIILFVVITILTSAVTGGVVYYSQLNNVNNLTTQHQADLDKLNQQIQDLQTQLADIQGNTNQVSEDKTYVDPITGFRIKYPANMQLELNKLYASAPNTLAINVQDINTLDMPQGWNKETAIKEKEALKNGEQRVYMDRGSSQEVIKLDGIYGLKFIETGGLEECSIMFQETFVFYIDNYQIAISMSGDKDAIISSMPQYFTKKNCGESYGWDYANKANEKFINDLKNGSASEVAQSWFDTFDTIISTITLKSNVLAVDPYEGWMTYTNSDYNYTLKYPNDWSVAPAKGESDTFGGKYQYVQFKSPNGQYMLHFGIREKGEDVYIFGRTGVGGGETVEGEVIKMAGTDIRIYNDVLSGKIVEFFLTSLRPGSSNQTIDGYEITGYFSDLKTAQNSINLSTNLSEYNIAKKILESYDREQQFQTPSSATSDQIGFIKSIEKVNDKYYVYIDYVLRATTQEEMIKVLIKAGTCTNSDDCIVRPGIYITNNNPLIRKFELLNTTNLNMVSDLRSDKKYMVRCLETIPQGQKVTIEELIAYVNYLNQQNDKTTYFKIKLNSDNKITEIYEQTFCLP